MRNLIAPPASIPYHRINPPRRRPKPCVVSLESPKGPGQFDPFLRIEDATGKVLAQDDDSGVDLNSLVVFTPPQAGVYRIVATCFQPAVGNYLRVVRQ